MQKIIVFLFALFTLTQLNAQKLEFVSIELDTQDQDSWKYPVRYGDGSDENICALVKVQLPLKGVVFENDFIIGEPQFKVNEYWVYMADGAAKLDIKHPDCEKLSVEFNMKLESKMTYVLKLKAEGFGTKSPTKVIDESKEKGTQEGTHDFSAYIGPQFQLLGFLGIGGMAGAYFKGFNAELEYTAGLTKSDKVYWNSTSVQSSSSYSYEYTPSYFGVSLGYAVVNGKSFRLTPQVGIGSVMLKGKEATKGTGTNPNATSGYAVSAHIGARADIRFGKSFGVFLTPRFVFAVSKSDLFQRVADVSSSVKGYATGFSAKLGAYYEF